MRVTYLFLFHEIYEATYLWLFISENQSPLVIPSYPIVWMCAGQVNELHVKQAYGKSERPAWEVGS